MYVYDNLYNFLFKIQPYIYIEYFTQVYWEPPSESLFGKFYFDFWNRWSPFRVFCYVRWFSMDVLKPMKGYFVW